MATDDDEHKELQTAIRESFQDHASTTATQFADPAPADPQNLNAKPVRRVNIDDRIKDLTLQPGLELPLINDPFGDTWIYIDPPPKQPEQDEFDYSRYLKRYETPMLVKRDTLLKYHAPDLDGGFNLERLFGPSTQFRISRRRNLTAKLRENRQIKYVIELTPPAEGEDAVFLTTELCCSQSVRLWYQASDIWRVSKNMVGGTEEYTSAKPPNHKDNYNSSSSPPHIFGPSEYSPVRHRSAIERVVAALMGIDPKLDSAPKVWTAFAVANYFCLKNSPLTDYIIRWLRAYPNSFFLEICPEVSLRIADGLENQDLARDTFAILVGEEALDSLRRSRMSEISNRYSIYGRRKEDLPERIYSRIEYASKSFQERIRTDFEDLVGKEMKWVEDLPEVRNLLSYQDSKLSNTVGALTRLLKDYVRGAIVRLLYVNYDYVPPPEFHNPGGEELIQRLSRASIWADLSANERILSRTFWLALLSFTLFEGPTNLAIKGGWDMDWEDAQSLEEESELDLGTYRAVHTEDLNRLIWEGDRLLAEQKKQPQFTLPDRTRSQAQAGLINTEDPSNRPNRPFNELYGAQIASSRDARSEPVWEPKPTPPIDIPQNTLRADPQPLRSDLELLRVMNTASHAAATCLPEGRPRKVSWDIKTKDDQGHEVLLDSNAGAANDLRTAQSQFTVSAPTDLPFRPQQHEVGAKAEVESQLPGQGAQDECSTSPSFGKPQTRLILPKPATAAKRSSVPVPASTIFFELTWFFSQARDSIKAIAKGKLQSADSGLRNEPHEVGITNTLVCLEDSEWKYLPLWAGGYDDGTGGVFSDQLPTAELGFTTSGPAVHTGFTPANSNSAASEFEMVDSESGIDTVNTSMVNNRSVAGALNRRLVYAADSMESSSSEDFEMVSAIEDPLEEEARRQMEAQERVEAAEEEAAGKVEKNKRKFADENYADLFDDDEDDEDAGSIDDNDTVMDDDGADDVIDFT